MTFSATRPPVSLADDPVCSGWACRRKSGTDLCPESNHVRRATFTQRRRWSYGPVPGDHRLGEHCGLDRRSGRTEWATMYLEESVANKTAETQVLVEQLVRLVTEIFQTVGCPEVEASLVAGELVLADQMGVKSHGSARVPEYVGAVLSGQVIPGGPCTVAGSFGGSILVDGGRNFGQITGRFALDRALEQGHRSGVSCVVTRNCFHLGRVGSLAERAAAHDMICIATVAVGFPGVVAPLGSSERVLGTNPFVYGVPTDHGPVVTDFATSAVAEGAIRLAAQAGGMLPEGVLVDANGNPTQDPNALFADPPGAILPFGGSQAHKGYALNLLPELVAAGLAGYGPHDPERPSNCLCLVLINPAAFLPIERFKKLAGDSARMVKAARPLSGCSVLLPGEREATELAAHASHVALSPATLEGLRRTARELDITVEL